MSWSADHEHMWVSDMETKLQVGDTWQYAFTCACGEFRWRIYPRTVMEID